MGILGVSMKEKKKISCGENRIFFEILLGIVLTAGIFFFLGIWFETNDDFVIYSMLSGAVSGRHEFHTMHNSVIFSLPMSLLYTLTDKISWYGFFYLFLHLLAFVLVWFFLIDYFLIFLWWIPLPSYITNIIITYFRNCIKTNFLLYFWIRW